MKSYRITKSLQNLLTQRLIDSNELLIQSNMCFVNVGGEAHLNMC
jgi:hypothetical protein